MSLSASNTTFQDVSGVGVCLPEFLTDTDSPTSGLPVCPTLRDTQTARLSPRFLCRCATLLTPLPFILSNLRTIRGEQKETGETQQVLLFLRKRLPPTSFSGLDGFCLLHCTFACSC